MGFPRIPLHSYIDKEEMVLNMRLWKILLFMMCFVYSFSIAFSEENGNDFSEKPLENNPTQFQKDAEALDREPVEDYEIKGETAISPAEITPDEKTDSSASTDEDRSTAEKPFDQEKNERAVSEAEAVEASSEKEVSEQTLPKDISEDSIDSPSGSVQMEAVKTERFVKESSGAIEESPRIPEALVYMDVKDNEKKYAVIVEKQTQKIFLYEYDGTFREVMHTQCSTGKNLGPKVVSGDSKTPEGIYFFVKEFVDKELSPIYGTRAFPIDYPNLMDRLAHRTGNAIWLHGTNKKLIDRDSNGCIVLDNTDIENIKSYIELNRTPMIIVEKISFEARDDKEKEAVIDVVSRYVRSIESGSYQDYVLVFSSKYVPDISWWTSWYEIRDTVKHNKRQIDIGIDNLSIFKHSRYYVALFDMILNVSGQKIWAGARKLFLAKNSEQLKIVGADYQRWPKTPESDTTIHPLVLAYREIESRMAVMEKTDEQGVEDAVTSAEIEEMIDNWLEAWSSKDIESYRAFYSKDFRSSGMNLDAWINNKSKLNKIYDFIQVTGKNLKIKKTKTNIRVSFIQTYRSSGYNAEGVKHLILKREGGQWKIYRETWEKM